MARSFDGQGGEVLQEKKKNRGENKRRSVSRPANNHPAGLSLTVLRASTFHLEHWCSILERHLRLRGEQEKQRGCCGNYLSRLTLSSDWDGHSRASV